MGSYHNFLITFQALNVFTLNDISCVEHRFCLMLIPNTIVFPGVTRGIQYITKDSGERVVSFYYFTHSLDRCGFRQEWSIADISELKLLTPHFPALVQ